MVRMETLSDGRVVNLSTARVLCFSCGRNGGCDDTRGVQLWRTAKGAYVLAHWSRWEGEDNEYEEVSRERARAFGGKWMDEDDFVREFGVASDI